SRPAATDRWSTDGFGYDGQVIEVTGAGGFNGPYTTFSESNNGEMLNLQPGSLNASSGALAGKTVLLPHSAGADNCADGKDTLTGSDVADVIHGGAGNDTIKGMQGSDDLFGGDDDDHIDGGADFDVLHGGAGDDTLDGGEGADAVFGDAGADTLNATV